MINLAEALDLEISPDANKRFGPCSCCGQMSSRVWGYISQQGVPLAAYFVEWTEGHEDRAANFDFIYGAWGEDASSNERVALSAAFRHIESGPSFMVIDAITRPAGSNSLVGNAMTRDEVLTSDLRSVLFALCDAVYLKDERIASLTI